MAYLTTSTKDFNRYSRSDLIELSNFFETKYLKQGDIIQEKGKPITHAFLVYLGAVEEINGRKILTYIQKNNFYKLDLLEDKYKIAQTTVRVRSATATLLMLPLAKLQENYEVASYNL